MTAPGPNGSAARLRVDEYLQLDASGRTELLGGAIRCQPPQHRTHARAKMHIYDALRAALSGRQPTVMVGVSVALSEHDAPAPDLTLTGEPLGEGLIPRDSVVLIVEVADATIRTDLGKKAAIYAAAGIPEYWVADVDARTIHQMWDPAEGMFAWRREVAFGQAVTAATIPGLTIATDRL